MTLRQQQEVFVEHGCQSAQAEHVDADCGELDRQGQPVEAKADISDDRRIGIGETEPVEARPRPLDKQLHRGKSQRLLGGQRARCGRCRDRLEPVDPLAFGAQCLPAGGENVNVRGTSKDGFRQRRNRIDHVLAVVEHEQQSLVLQERRQAGNRTGGRNGKPQHRRHRERDELPVDDRRQIDEPDAIVVDRKQLLGRGDRNRGLADAAGPGDGDATTHRHLQRDRLDRVATSQHARQRGGKVMAGSARGGGGLGCRSHLPRGPAPRSNSRAPSH